VVLASSTNNVASSHLPLRDKFGSSLSHGQRSFVLPRLVLHNAALHRLFVHSLSMFTEPSGRNGGMHELNRKAVMLSNRVRRVSSLFKVPGSRQVSSITSFELRFWSRVVGSLPACRRSHLSQCGAVVVPSLALPGANKARHCQAIDANVVIPPVRQQQSRSSKPGLLGKDFDGLCSDILLTPTSGHALRSAPSPTASN
jgi:hypothetical protein